jgi:hypothetical protein
MEIEMKLYDVVATIENAGLYAKISTVAVGPHVGQMLVMAMENRAVVERDYRDIATIRRPQIPHFAVRFDGGETVAENGENWVGFALDRAIVESKRAADLYQEYIDGIAA